MSDNEYSPANLLYKVREKEYNLRNMNKITVGDLFECLLCIPEVNQRFSRNDIKILVGEKILNMELNEETEKTNLLSYIKLYRNT